MVKQTVGTEETKVFNYNTKVYKHTLHSVSFCYLFSLLDVSVFFLN